MYSMYLICVHCKCTGDNDEVNLSKKKKLTGNLIAVIWAICVKSIEFMNLNIGFST